MKKNEEKRGLDLGFDGQELAGTLERAFGSVKRDERSGVVTAALKAMRWRHKSELSKLYDETGLDERIRLMEAARGICKPVDPNRDKMSFLAWCTGTAASMDDRHEGVKDPLEDYETEDPLLKHFEEG